MTSEPMSDTGGADRPDPPPTPFRTLLCPMGHKMAGFDSAPRDRGCRVCQALGVNPHDEVEKKARGVMTPAEAGALGGAATVKARREDAKAEMVAFINTPFVQAALKLGYRFPDVPEAEIVQLAVRMSDDAEEYDRWARDFFSL